MKRILLLLLALIMLLSCMTACGDDTDQPTAPSGTTSRQGTEPSSSTSGEQTQPAPETTEPQPDPAKVAELTLDREACVLFTDETATFTLTATNAYGDALTDPDIDIRITDSTVATVTASGNTLTVTPAAPGRTTLAVATKDGEVTATANVTVNLFESNGSGEPGAQLETMQNILVYHRAMYENPGISKANAQAYAKVMESYADLFPEAQVTMLVAPKSSMMLCDDPEVGSRFSDQKEILDTIYGYCSERIKTVPTYEPIMAHRDDYLFFRSDHHWTSLGAYYAYVSLCQTLGLPAADLSAYDCSLRNDRYQGTMYSFSGKNRRTAQVYDSIYLYSLPQKTVSMTITYAGGGTRTYDSCFIPGYQNYLTYINGDTPLTVITVAENDPQKCILVLKDSFGCCFVPFLTENFGTIVVVDPREADFLLQTKLKEYAFSDVLFVTSIFNPSASSWINNCNRIIGR